MWLSWEFISAALCVEGQFEGEQALIYGLQVKCSKYKELFSPCGIEMLSSFWSWCLKMCIHCQSGSEETKPWSWLGYCINKSTEEEKLLIQLCNMEKWRWVCGWGSCSGQSFHLFQWQNITTGFSSPSVTECHHWLTSRWHWGVLQAVGSCWNTGALVFCNQK